MSASIPRDEWAAIQATFEAIGQVSQVYVHYTAGSIVGGADASQAIEEKALRAWEAFHVNQRDMRSIAYNVLACQSGRRYIGRGNGGIPSTRVAGGHTACCNTTSVAVCATIGAGEKPTEELVAAIRETVADWKAADVTTADPRIDGHRDAPGAATPCPGDPLYARLDEIRAEDDMAFEEYIAGEKAYRQKHQESGDPGPAPEGKPEHFKAGWRAARFAAMNPTQVGQSIEAHKHIPTDIPHGHPYSGTTGAPVEG